MSTTTDAIRIIDKMEHETAMSRETATELIDYVESQRGDLATEQDLRVEIAPLKQGQQWLKWVMLGGFTVLATFMIGGFTLLNTRVEVTRAELKAEINGLESKLGQRMDKLDQRMDKLEGKIDQLLLRQKR